MSRDGSGHATPPDEGADRGLDGDPAGASAERASDGSSLVCEVCGGVMFERHCKILCPRCGYQRDCSDP